MSLTGSIVVSCENHDVIVANCENHDVININHIVVTGESHNYTQGHLHLPFAKLRCFKSASCYT